MLRTRSPCADMPSKRLDTCGDSFAQEVSTVGRAGSHSSARAQVNKPGCWSLGSFQFSAGFFTLARLPFWSGQFFVTGGRPVLCWVVHSAAFLASVHLTQEPPQLCKPKQPSWHCQMPLEEQNPFHCEPLAQSDAWELQWTRTIIRQGLQKGVYTKSVKPS